MPPTMYGIHMTGGVSVEAARDQAWLASDPDEDELARATARELVYVIYRVRFAPHLVYFPAQAVTKVQQISLIFQPVPSQTGSTIWAFVGQRKKKADSDLSLLQSGDPKTPCMQGVIIMEPVCSPPTRYIAR